MKTIAMLLCLFLALSGCRRETSAEPVWRQSLAGGGEAMLSGCTVLSEETAWYLPKGEQTGEELPLLRVEGIPTLTLTGVDAELVDVQFVCPTGEGSYGDERANTLEKVDYRLTRQEDGTLEYLLDNVYNYRICVGQQNWLLICYREGIREP